jgi:hypothetical protein
MLLVLKVLLSICIILGSTCFLQAPFRLQFFWSGLPPDVDSISLERLRPRGIGFSAPESVATVAHPKYCEWHYGTGCPRGSLVAGHAQEENHAKAPVSEYRPPQRGKRGSSAVMGHADTVLQ